MSILLKNSTCLRLSPPAVEQADIRIHDGKVVERASQIPLRHNDDVYDLSGKFLLPGFVCGHTHLYSALSRGMPLPKESPENFLDILTRIWWKLDRALDEETIYYSALVGAVDALRAGTTTLVDHHASPRAIHGSLDIIKEAIEEIGLRGVLCYETTDRGGKKERDQGVLENERFIRANRKNPSFRGLVGAHASFTLDDASLRLCGELAAACKTGVHIHAAEDQADIIDAEETYGCSVIDRLEQTGCLRENSILAHGVHLSRNDIQHAQRARCWIIHNPRSNMNNAVGHAPIHLFGDRTAIGTDGFPADMFEETKIGFCKMKDAKIPQVDLVDTLQAGQRMISELFGTQFGTLTKGSAADCVVLDYVPPTTLTNDNLAGHFLFGMQSSNVESVMVDGKWVLKNRVVVGVDLPTLYAKARKAAKKLWTKMEKLD